ncbi:hypothetical protein [Burkholderia ubonensis]|uniref:hypothetical protein n=1 Tax=Burkholderia ubonensis TaxID=101571 RepID=UPI000A3E4D5E|nr:hypothetical protein [Burkholderia ubonensis]
MRANIQTLPDHAQSIIAAVSAALAEAFEHAPEEVRSSGTLAFLDTDVDGAGGAVLQALRDLSRFDLAVICAAAIPTGHPSGARASAIKVLAAFILPTRLARHIGGALASCLVARHFSGRGSYAEIADIHGFAPSTIGRHARAVSEMLSVEEHATWNRLASRLRDSPTDVRPYASSLTCAI